MADFGRWPILADPLTWPGTNSIILQVHFLVESRINCCAVLQMLISGLIS